MILLSAERGEMAAAAKQVVAYSLQHRPGPGRIIGIDGLSGAGKTSFADAVAKEINGSVQVVHMDDIYAGWHGLAEAPALLSEWILEPYRDGVTARFLAWDWGKDCRGEKITVEPTDWLIVEGVGVGATQSRPYLDVLVWLDCDATVRKERALARDGEVLTAHWEMWQEQEQALLEESLPVRTADIAVTT